MSKRKIWKDQENDEVYLKSTVEAQHPKAQVQLKPL